MTEVDQYVEDIRGELNELENLAKDGRYEEIETRVSTVSDKVAAVTNAFEAVEQAFQRYDEANRTEMDDWYERLSDLEEDLENQHDAADRAASELNSITTRLEAYKEPDERTQELLEVTDDLAEVVHGDDGA